MPIPTTPIDLLGAPARDEVYALLLGRLVTGELAPGTRLSDRELLALTGSSRGPLREALSRLVHVGLVTVVPRQHTEVTPLDDRRARDSLAVLAEVVEQAVVEVVPSLRDDERRAMTRVVDTGPEHATQARQELAELLLTAAGNREYTRIADDVSPYVRRALTLAPTVDSEGVARHLRAFVQAAADGDVAGAVAAWHAQEARTVASFADPAGSTPDRRPPAGGPAATLRDKAGDTIEAAILDGTLVPGETLRESALMTWLGISRTPVREALLQLGGRGLVEVRHHQPARVATMDRATSLDAVRAVGVLRRLGVRDAMRDDPDGFATRMGRVLAGWTGPGSAGEAVYAIADAIEACSGNLVWRDVHRVLTARVRWCASHDPELVRLADPVVVKAILDALVAGDARAGSRLIWDLHDRMTVTHR
jgi:DNA-binding GntR family transcriptional regulator